MSAASPLLSLLEARAALAGARVWVVSDGKAGDLNQCLGVAEQLGLQADSRIVKPRTPWRWFMPRLWSTPLGIDPAEAPGKTDGPLQGPLPQIVLASGRRAASYLPAIKRASGGRAFTVFLKDPRTSAEIADFIWVPQHDALRGPNVLATLLSPHRLSPQKLAMARSSLRPEIARLPGPRVAVLAGGTSRDFTFSRFDMVRLAADLDNLAREGASLMITPSRRTPEDLKAALMSVITERGGYWWEPDTPNPYFEMLATADAIVVTADSVNMVGEALVTGKPVMVFRPSGGSRKIDDFLAAVQSAGLTRPFAGTLERYSYAPQDATPLIALELARRYFAFRSELKT
ncbi:MAG: mitochondrial fission ELM1 family protein [Proteobacteria bacterium]|nr:mitochondrial fission ELM1 family protein [Pseudomonadota bacterium]